MPYAKKLTLAQILERLTLTTEAAGLWAKATDVVITDLFVNVVAGDTARWYRIDGRAREEYEPVLDPVKQQRELPMEKRGVLAYGAFGELTTLRYATGGALGVLWARGVNLRAKR